MMRITFYHTLYKKLVTENVFGDIVFRDGCVVYSTGGHRHAVEYEYVRKIEVAED